MSVQGILQRRALRCRHPHPQILRSTTRLGCCLEEAKESRKSKSQELHRRGPTGLVHDIGRGEDEAHSLLDKPNQIFNVDETGFSDKTKGE